MVGFIRDFLFRRKGKAPAGEPHDQAELRLAAAALLVDIVGDTNPLLLLVVIYLLTLVFTELVSNTAIAVCMFPLAIEVAVLAGYNPRPFAMAIAMAASSSFLTPIGYQTNLMVYGPGGYQPGDYFRAGLPLAVLVTLTALTINPIIWPFA